MVRVTPNMIKRLNRKLKYPSLVLPLQDIHKIRVNLEYIMLSTNKTDLLRLISQTVS